MKSLAHKFVLLTLAVLLALPLCAAEGKKRGGKKGEGKQDQVSQLLAKLEKANLTADQKTKVDEVIAKFKDKIAEARKAVPAEVQKAMNDARKQASADGKKGKELDEAVKAAVKLTDEQAAALQELRDLNMAMVKEVAGLLTEEQRTAAELKIGGGRKRNQ